MANLAENSIRQFVEAGRQPAVVEIKGGDRLFHQLFLTFLRHEPQVEWLLRNWCPRKIRADIRSVLNWGMTELLWLNGLPAPVVVHVAVEYTKTFSRQEAGFVNAVLRRVSREKEAGKDLFGDAPDSVKASLPDVLWKRWSRLHGLAEAFSMAQVLLEQAPPVFRKCSPNADCAGMVKLEAPDWAPQAELYLSGDRSLGEIMAKSGSFYVQDPATLMAPVMLHAVPGEKVLDACCAPGGKSRLLAEAMCGKGVLICMDREKEKLPRVRENLNSFANVEILAGDAVQSTYGAPFDAILLDVPCSNSGVIRRRPDVRREFSVKRLAAHVELQRKILERQSANLSSNGRLVYSTCSIEPEENGQLIREFLADHPEFYLKQEREILPDKMHDGAYAACLVRNNG